jgi:hypothetical protein
MLAQSDILGKFKRLSQSTSELASSTMMLSTHDKALRRAEPKRPVALNGKVSVGALELGQACGL